MAQANINVGFDPKSQTLQFVVDGNVILGRSPAELLSDVTGDGRNEDRHGYGYGTVLYDFAGHDPFVLIGEVWRGGHEKAKRLSVKAVGTDYFEGVFGANGDSDPSLLPIEPSWKREIVSGWTLARRFGSCKVDEADARKRYVPCDPSDPDAEIRLLDMGVLGVVSDHIYFVSVRDFFEGGKKVIKKEIVDASGTPIAEIRFKVFKQDPQTGQKVHIFEVREFDNDGKLGPQLEVRQSLSCPQTGTALCAYWDWKDAEGAVTGRAAYYCTIKAKSERKPSRSGPKSQGKGKGNKAKGKDAANPKGKKRGKKDGERKARPEGRDEGPQGSVLVQQHGGSTRVYRTEVTASVELSEADRDALNTRFGPVNGCLIANMAEGNCKLNVEFGKKPLTKQRALDLLAEARSSANGAETVTA